MTRGRQLPVNSKVRRRLFVEDEIPECPILQTCGGFHNVMKSEFIARTLNNELIMKGMKWSFDFSTEKALRGYIQWYRKESSNKWVVMEPTGTSFYLRKRRSTESLTESKFTHEEERRKVRRLSPETVALRQEFFEEGRMLDMTLRRVVDDNEINQFHENPPEYSSISLSSSRSDVYSTEDEDESGDLNNQDDTEDEASIKLQDIYGVNTDVMVDTYYHGTSADMFEVEKDANDNQEPLISEDEFEKLHVKDNDNTGITEEDEEKPNDMKNMNEATPKNEKKAIAEPNKGTPLRIRNDKAKKKLDNSCN